MWGQIVLEQIVINRIEKCCWVHNVFIILRIWGHSLITLHVTNSWYWFYIAHEETETWETIPWSIHRKSVYKDLRTSGPQHSTALFWREDGVSFNENSVLSGFDGKFLSRLKVSWLPSLPLDGNLSEGQHRLSGCRSSCAAHGESAQRAFELLWALCHPLPSVRLFTTCKSGPDAP